MNHRRLLNLMGEIDEKYVEEAEEAGRKRSRRVWVGLGVSAACVALAVTAALAHPGPSGDKDDIQIRIVSQGTHGDGDRYDGTVAGFVDASTDLPETFPVYINNYPTGQGGPLYEVTDTLKTTLSNNLSRYLGLLYDDVSLQNVEFSSDPDLAHRVYYERNATYVGSFPEGFSASSSSDGISGNASDAVLLNHPLVKAAISYLGLTDPVVTRTVEYKLDGTVSEWTYEITERTDDVFRHILNREFSCITVRWYPGIEDQVSVHITDIASEGLVEYADYPTLSYASVLTALASCYPDMDMTDVEAEIYYNAAIQPGYFIPCCRFYFKDGVKTSSTGDAYPTYTVVDVLLIDGFVVE